MTILADDPTVAAIFDAVPCYPVPWEGRSPAIDALRAAPNGRGVAVGRDGVMLIMRRPWLEADVLVTAAMDAPIPYGSVGAPHAALRCGLIPRAHLETIIDHFRAALPNEAAAFVIWNEETGAFTVEFPDVDETTTSRIVFRYPKPALGSHMVCDIHSHGRGAAFFSATDDDDDAHWTKISIVIGRLDNPAGPTMVSRLCVSGLFLPLPRSPFAGGNDDA
jgi:PRTRC genetic system protein A